MRLIHILNLFGKSFCKYSSEKYTLKNTLWCSDKKGNFSQQGGGGPLIQPDLSIYYQKLWAFRGSQTCFMKWKINQIFFGLKKHDVWKKKSKVCSPSRASLLTGLPAVSRWRSCSSSNQLIHIYLASLVLLTHGPCAAFHTLSNTSTNSLQL